MDERVIHMKKSGKNLTDLLLFFGTINFGLIGILWLKNRTGNRLNAAGKLK